MKNLIVKFRDRFLSPVLGQLGDIAKEQRELFEMAAAVERELLSCAERDRQLQEQVSVLLKKCDDIARAVGTMREGQLPEITGRLENINRATQEQILEMKGKLANIQDTIQQQMPGMAGQLENIQSTIQQQVPEMAEQLESLGRTVQKWVPDQLEEICQRIQDIGNVRSETYVISKTRRFAHDFLWVTSSDANDMITEYIQQGFVGKTIWDGPDESLWDMLPQKGTVLDLGANVGAFLFPLVAKGWTGYAVEASRRNADVLQKSIDLNRFDIKICEKAVYSKTGVVFFVQKGPQSYVKDSVHPLESYEEVRAIALNDYKDDPILGDIRHIDLIKMDIEGSEPEAIRGMDRFLEEFGYPPIYSEINVWNLFCFGWTQRKFFLQMQALGYTPYQHRKDGLYQLSMDYLPETPCTDVFFLQKNDPMLGGYIRGEVDQDYEQMLGKNIQLLRDMKNYLALGQRDEQPLLPHIALYSYIEDYPAYAIDETICSLKLEIAQILKNSTHPIYQKMLEMGNPHTSS